MSDRHDPRTDDVLLRAIAQEDVEALTELYRRYAGRGLTLARQHAVPDPAQVVEDAFVTLFRSAHGFRRSALPADVWTLGMVQRHCSTLASGAALISTQA